jgi:uncharacterized protein (DUF305 family)
MLSLLLLPAALGAGHGVGHECDKTGTGEITLKMKWDEFASEWGMYTIDGCDGVSPQLKLSADATYIFDQTDISNWYHPVGFAYIAGGAHTECKQADGSVGECPELGGEDPTTIQYHVDGAPVTDDDSGFGLDAYEPLFFNDQGNWAEQDFRVTLKIPADATYTKIYYFCHIHMGMSAEIIIDGTAGGNVLHPDALGQETEASALAIFDDIVATHQPALSDFDEKCGFHNTLGEMFDNNDACKHKHFVCGDGAADDFNKCLTAVDCQMHVNMAVGAPAGVSKFATFARQMISHHENAVAMAKVLSKHMTAADFPAAGTEDQDMEWAQGLIRSIISVQNHQTHGMRSWLEANPSLAKESTSCYDTDPIEVVTVENAQTIQTKLDKAVADVADADADNAVAKQSQKDAEAELAAARADLAKCEEDLK